MASRRLMDDPRLLLSRPFRAVHFVFGLTWPEVQPLPGTALVASLESLGMSRSAARGLLLRLRRAGAFTSSRQGRTATYALTPASRRLLDEISGRATEDPPPWDGVFRAALVTVPESTRAYREVLRRQAAYAGFGSLRRGLLIAPYETSWSAFEPVLARAPRGTHVLRAELRLTAADARQARRVWPSRLPGRRRWRRCGRRSARSSKRSRASPRCRSSYCRRIGPWRRRDGPSRTSRPSRPQPRGPTSTRSWGRTCGLAR
jgi:hypothetical protein